MYKRHAKLEVKEEFLPYSENCGILGLAPYSTKSSYFQRGRVDGRIITWLKKGYSLWKPKDEAKPKNKFPW